MLNIFMCYTPPKFYLVNLQYSIYEHVFTSRVKNSVDPDQMGSTAFFKKDFRGSAEQRLIIAYEEIHHL